MQKFVLGFLTATSIALSSYFSYVMFCPHYKKIQQPIHMQMATPKVDIFVIPEQQLLPVQPILPKEGDLHHNDA